MKVIIAGLPEKTGFKGTIEAETANRGDSPVLKAGARGGGEFLTNFGNKLLRDVSRAVCLRF
ncbi:MAG: hypothetical protein ACYCOR_04990 [Acidobacteriaceae bacterium]